MCLDVTRGNPALSDDWGGSVLMTILNNDPHKDNFPDKSPLSDRSMPPNSGVTDVIPLHK